jgi:hypothetical protein
VVKRAVNKFLINKLLIIQILFLITCRSPLEFTKNIKNTHKKKSLKKLEIFSFTRKAVQLFDLVLVWTLNTNQYASPNSIRCSHHRCRSDNSVRIHRLHRLSSLNFHRGRWDMKRFSQNTNRAQLTSTSC